MSKLVAVATWKFGQTAVAASGAALTAGGSAMDAVESGIRTAELDPTVGSVGYGGLPNEDGVVQMDAAVMSWTAHDGCWVSGGAGGGARSDLGSAARDVGLAARCFSWAKGRGGSPGGMASRLRRR